MDDENKVQEPEQEQEQVPEQVQETEPVQETVGNPQDKPAKEKNGGGVLMPILYALLAAVGAFTLVMIAGIVWTILTRPAQSPESPSEEPSIQIAQTQSYQSPNSGDSYPGAEV